MINLELTDQEALQFRDWRKYQDQFSILLEAQVFKTRLGKAVIHFDQDCQIREITFDTIGWRQRKI